MSPTGPLRPPRRSLLQLARPSAPSALPSETSERAAAGELHVLIRTVPAPLQRIEQATRPRGSDFRGTNAERSSSCSTLSVKCTAPCSHLVLRPRS